MFKIDSETLEIDCLLGHLWNERWHVWLWEDCTFGRLVLGVSLSWSSCWVMAPAVATPFLSFLDLLRIIQGMFLGRKRRHNFFFVVSILTKNRCSNGEPGLNKKQGENLSFLGSQCSNEKNGPWLFLLYHGLHSPEIWGLFHKPW